MDSVEDALALINHRWDTRTLLGGKVVTFVAFSTPLKPNEWLDMGHYWMIPPDPDRDS